LQDSLITFIEEMKTVYSLAKSTSISFNNFFRLAPCTVGSAILIILTSLLNHDHQQQAKLYSSI
jgi:hypothetical protein